MEYPFLKRHLKIWRVQRERNSMRLQIGWIRGSGVQLEGSARLMKALGLMDGCRTVADIKRKLGLKSSSDDLENMVKALVRHHLVDLIRPRPQPGSFRREGDRYWKHEAFYSMFTSNADAIEIQSALADKKILLVGAGGIGSMVAYLLSASGLGLLRLIDPDRVELSNLTRQVLYDSSDLGKTKVSVARRKLLRNNPHCRVETATLRVRRPGDIQPHLEGMDFAVLSADTPSSILLWMDAACRVTGVPWINSGYYDHVAVCGPLIVPPKSPCLSCWIGKKLADSAKEEEWIRGVNHRFVVPSFGPVNSLSASLAAMETIKFLTGFSKPKTMDARCFLDPISFRIWRERIRPGLAHCSHRDMDPRYRTEEGK